jgi:hypothetical protein
LNLIFGARRRQTARTRGGPTRKGPVGRWAAYYRTRCRLTPELRAAARVWLCFGAADYIAEVFVNGTFVGRHEAELWMETWRSEGTKRPTAVDLTTYPNNFVGGAVHARGLPTAGRHHLLDRDPPAR